MSGGDVRIHEAKGSSAKDITQTQICYGPSKNNSSQQNNQQQVKILKKESVTKPIKENNADLKCMLCNDPHATHRCPLTRHLRD